MGQSWHQFTGALPVRFAAVVKNLVRRRHPRSQPSLIDGWTRDVIEPLRSRALFQFGLMNSLPIPNPFHWNTQCLQRKLKPDKEGTRSNLDKEKGSAERVCRSVHHRKRYLEAFWPWP